MSEFPTLTDSDLISTLSGVLDEPLQLKAPRDIGGSFVVESEPIGQKITAVICNVEYSRSLYITTFGVDPNRPAVCSARASSQKDLRGVFNPDSVDDVPANDPRRDKLEGLPMLCSECPRAEMKKGGRSDCAPRCELTLAVSDCRVPLKLVCPPTSQLSWKSYLSTLALKGKSFKAVKTQISSSQARNESFCRIQFDFLEELDFDPDFGLY